MAITEEQVRHVAKLAKLEFAPHEIKHFTEQLGDIIDMVEQLEAVDTTDVPRDFPWLCIEECHA